MLLLGLLVPGCRPRDPIDRLAAQLGDPTRCDHAVEGLLVQVRQASARERSQVQGRVVRALVEAYRDDVARPQIVTALAMLRDPRAEDVFVRALDDAERGGAHFEAAVRSARMIGELGLKRRVPQLTAALARALRSPRQDANTWLERSLIQSLDRLGDRRAVPVLIQALQADPARMDFYVSRLAARALGTLRDERAVPPLVASLGATKHGLLLFEESRRALCRIGPPATKGLLDAATARDRSSRLATDAPAAARVLGDFGPSAATSAARGPEITPRSTAAALLAALRPGDPTEYRLAVAETLLRLGERQGETLLVTLLGDRTAAVSGRKRAAELLGWYGQPETITPHLRPSCEKRGPAEDLLCWSVVLAFSRLAHGGPEPLDKLLDARQDTSLRHYVQMYRVRLLLEGTCGGEPSCHAEQLARASDWRTRERAALELGRGGHGLIPLASALAKEHPQVQQAILTALEQMEIGAVERKQVASILAQVTRPKEKDDERVVPPAILSRAVCLIERLQRENGEKR